MAYLLNTWELPGLIMLSLFFQFVLVIFGTWRKYRASILVSIAHWLADWVANVSLAFLLKKDTKELSGDIIMLWTPILLLHLGGPNSISTYSSDDELWKKYLLGLCIQLGVAVYVCKSFGTNSTPTYMAIPIFIAGIINYGERIWILRAASWKQFSNSIFKAPRPFFLTHLPSQTGPMGDRPAVDHEHKTTLDEYLVNKGVIQEGKNIHKAFHLYKLFIPLFSDRRLRLHKDSAEVIILQSSSVKLENAFKLVHMELGFLYDVLYTKTAILLSITGVILRSICFLSTLSALVAFSIIADKRHYPKPDIAMTYALLVGAFFLDAHSAILQVLSNWTMLYLTSSDNKVRKFIGSGRVSWLIGCHDGDKKEIESMAQHNLIDYCLKTPWWSKIVRCIDTEDNLKKFWGTTWKPVNLELKKFIHSSLENRQKKYVALELRYKALLDLLGDKGKSVLESKGVLDPFINWSIEEVEFGHSLLLWHIATCLLYHVDYRKYSGGALGSCCQISKLLSDYMMYLLLVRPLMLPKGIGEVRIRETRAEVLRILNLQRSQTESEAANALFYGISVLPNVNQLVQSKSVLNDGISLACRLQALVEEMLWDHEEKWELIADVWMEMLVFAASKCEWREHTTQLKNGPELITHVALLMAHFGLTDQMRIAEGETSSTLIPDTEIVTERWDWELSHLAYYLA